MIGGRASRDKGMNEYQLRKGPKPRPVQNRFDEKYIPEPMSGCWLWTGTLTTSGYGELHVRVRGAERFAHRISWELHRGQIPDGLFVLHRCDNPCCVNPDHLFLGTQADNIHDAIAKGRHSSPPQGVARANVLRGRHHWQKLTANQIPAIRSRLISGATLQAIADEFGVTFQTISKIKLGTRWAYV